MARENNEMEKKEYSGKNLIILRKTRELYILANRVKRYWKRLAKEAIEIAKEKGLESEIVDLDNLDESVLSASGSKIIPIYLEGEAFNDEILLKLVKSKFPTLYRKYHQQKEKYEEKFDELENLVHSE